MIKRKTKQELMELAENVIQSDVVLNYFKQCVEVLDIHKEKTLYYFELFHEFGHVAYGFEMDAQLVYTQVGSYRFMFKNNSVETIETNPQSPHTLLYFRSEEKLTMRWIHAVRGGLEFSLQACGIKCYSLASFIFNRTNKLGYVNRKPGSDPYLLEHLSYEDNAQRFNNSAKERAMKVHFETAVNLL